MTDNQGLFKGYEEDHEQLEKDKKANEDLTSIVLSVPSCTSAELSAGVLVSSREAMRRTSCRRAFPSGGSRCPAVVVIGQ